MASETPTKAAKSEDVAEDEDLGDALEAPPPAPDVQPIPVGLIPEPGRVVLRMPRGHSYEDGFEFPEGNLDFGPGSKHSPHYAQTNIKFHSDGMGDGYASVPEDHQALGDLLARYPQVEVVSATPQPTLYICSVCDKELKSKPGLQQHMKTHQK